MGCISSLLLLYNFLLSAGLQLLEDILDDDADMSDMYLGRRAQMSATTALQTDGPQHDMPNSNSPGIPFITLHQVNWFSSSRLVQAALISSNGVQIFSSNAVVDDLSLATSWQTCMTVACTMWYLDTYCIQKTQQLKATQTQNEPDLTAPLLLQTGSVCCLQAKLHARRAAICALLRISFHVCTIPCMHS